MCRISIIMGIYNCEATLDEAIESILHQTYTGWKLIMCDDGSVDGTYDKAKQYEEQYNNIYVYRNKKNMGLNYTLNHCLKYVDTEYVARMDGDDVSLPMRLEKEIDFLDKNPEMAIVSTPMIYFDGNREWGKGKAISWPMPLDFIKGTPFCHAPCMIRTEALKSVGGYSYNKRTFRAEDYDMWFRMYEKGYRGHNLSEPLYKMRDDLNAFSRRKFKYSINEAYVRFTGYRRLKLPIKAYIYVLRPIAVGLIPRSLYLNLHHSRFNR